MNKGTYVSCTIHKNTFLGYFRSSLVTELFLMADTAFILMNSEKLGTETGPFLVFLFIFYFYLYKYFHV